MRLDPAAIRRQIEILLTAYPELADDEVLRLDMIEGSTDMIEFMRALEVARQQANATADAVGALIDNWRQRMARFQKRDEAIRALMFKLLQLAHLKKLELPEATVSLKIGVPKVVIIDEAALPDEFCRIRREPDRAKIKAALADFKAVPGATLSNGEDSLAVRIK
jgi:Siphovirus Gp157